MNSFKTKIFSCSLFLFLNLPILQAFAQFNGEIINISQEYKTAFADLGSGVLTVGNVLRIQTNANAFVYLQVVETNPGLSKLSFIESGEYKTDPSKFSSIIVGNSFTVVSKDTQGPIKKLDLESTPDSKEMRNSQFSAALETKEKEINDLKTKLKNSDDLLKSMRQQNSQLLLEKQINEQDRDTRLREIEHLKNMISQLREKMNRVTRLTQPTSALDNSKDRAK